MHLNRLTLKIVIFMATTMLQICPALSNESHWYRETTGKQIFDFFWEWIDSNPHVITVAGNGEYFSNMCGLSCRTIEWRFVREGTDIRAIRDDDVIRMEGKFNGKPFIKGFRIDDNPWYQPLSFSLRCFLDNPEPETLFWMIRPDTLDVTKFKIKKLGREAFIYNGRPTWTQKMELGLTSLLEGLWQAHYWFREEDGVFVQYRGVHGLPGTPETLVRMIE